MSLPYAAKPSLCGIVVLVVIFWLPAWVHGQLLGDKEVFLRDATQAWREYQEGARQLQGTADYTLWSVTENRTEIKERQTLELKQCGDWAFIKWAAPIRKSDGLTYGTAWLINSKYFAAVQERAEGRGWLLTDFDQDFKDGKPVKPKRVVRSALRNACSLISVEKNPLPDIVRNPTFKLKGVDRGATDQPRVDFAVDRPENGPLRIEGWVLLDPHRHWIVNAGELKVVYSGGIAGDIAFENEYRQGSAGIAIPTRTVRRRTLFPDLSRQSAGVKDEEEATFHFREEDNVPEIEFSLSTFGLPEPVGVSFPRPTRWYFWFAVAGVCCFGMALGLYKLARRRASAPMPEKT
jgi:hypothetical protein